MTDIIGPANAPFAVTARPAETRVFGLVDSWFTDCTSLTANDGTRVQAGWLNAVSAAFRALTRLNGNLVAGGPVVVEDNSDAMVAGAIQQLIQRGQSSYADDAGTANHLVVNLSPAAREYKKGMVVVTQVAVANTGPAWLNVSGLGEKLIKHADGSDLSQGDLLAAGMAAFGYDGTRFQLVWSQRQPGAPIYLQAARDYYVGGAGASDSNDGLSLGTPFATLQKAEDTAAGFNLNGNSINIHVAGGATYAPVTFRAISGAGSVNYIASAANCVIAGVSASSVTAADCGRAHTMSGFTYTAAGTYISDPMLGLHVSGTGSHVSINNATWGACAGGHYSVEQGGTLILTGTETVTGGCVGSTGGNGAHANVANSATLQTPGAVALSITTAVSFAAGWFTAAGCALGQMLYSSVSGAGNVTGQRYNVGTNAVINTNGGGANYYPGTIAGAQNSGGQYV